MEASRRLLVNGLQEMGLVLSAQAQEKLLTYVELLMKWNKVYNLTAVRIPEQMITQHILDSLTLLPYLQNIHAVLDVGTGAGLPGIPLAIARPDLEFKLLDSQQKKINFVQHVITSLQLSNASAVWSRVEALPAEHTVDMVVSRAFASLHDYVNLIANVCNKKTKIIAMKGRTEQVLSEQQQLSTMFKVVRVEAVAVPGTDAERCLVFLEKQGD